MPLVNFLLARDQSIFNLRKESMIMNFAIGLLPDMLIKVVNINELTFPSKAFLAEEADHGKKLGDLFQVYDCGVVQVNDGHRVFVMG